MLAREGHHTPFESSLLHFSIICDTATQIQLLKHRIGVSINGESARYKELKVDKFLVPEDWPELMKEELEVYAGLLYKAYHTYLPILEKHLGRKRAKESARYFVPYCNQTQLDVKMNFRSFMHFQGLRNKPDAQLEIQELAEQMLDLVRGIPEYKYSLEAFNY
jgi:thymidylate synthase (FAD)